MATVELSCTECNLPLRIETFTGHQIVINKWYIGIGNYNNTEDLCNECFQKEIDGRWMSETIDQCVKSSKIK